MSFNAIKKGIKRKLPNDSKDVPNKKRRKIIKFKNDLVFTKNIFDILKEHAEELELWEWYHDSILVINLAYCIDESYHQIYQSYFQEWLVALYQANNIITSPPEVEFQEDEGNQLFCYFTKDNESDGSNIDAIDDIKEVAECLKSTVEAYKSHKDKCKPDDHGNLSQVAKLFFQAIENQYKMKIPNDIQDTIMQYNCPVPGG